MFSGVNLQDTQYYDRAQAAFVIDFSSAPGTFELSIIDLYAIVESLNENPQIN